MATKARAIPKKLAASVTQFRWNDKVGRFVDGRTGQFVSRTKVINGLDSALEAAKQRGRSLSEQLQRGELSLRDWEQGMRQTVKEVHLYSAATARGGWGQMTFTDYGNVGPAMRFQYERLHNFAGDISKGMPLDGRFMSRTELYMLSGRSSFHRQDEIVQTELGMTEERNVLHPADHCDGCLGETAREWVGIGKLVPPGQRICLGRCKCIIEYRKGEGEGQVTEGRPLEEVDQDEMNGILAQPSDFYRRIDQNAIETVDRFSKDGIYTKERRELHDAIIEQHLQGFSPVPNPKVQVIGGGPASGKGGMMRYIDTNNAVTMDVDEIRTMLPEYREGLKLGQLDIAAITHEESSYIGKRIVSEATQRGHNLVVDGTADGTIESLTAKVNGYRKYGHQIIANYISADTEVAVFRASLRAARTGRAVPETVIREVHRNVSVTLPKAMESGLFDTVSLYDNNGRAPVLIATGGRDGKTQILNKRAWRRFLKKADADLPTGAAPFVAEGVSAVAPDLILPRKVGIDPLPSTRAKVHILDPEGNKLNRAVNYLRLKEDGTYTGRVTLKAVGKPQFTFQVTSRDGINWVAEGRKTARAGAAAPKVNKVLAPVSPNIPRGLTGFGGYLVDEIGDVSAGFVAEASAALKNLPVKHLQMLERNGHRFYFTERSLVAFPDLAGLQPRGWYQGATWDHVGGLARWGSKKASVSEKTLRFGSTTEYQLNERVGSTVRHEIGHQIDQALGVTNGDTPELFLDIYRQEVALAEQNWGADGTGLELRDGLGNVLFPKADRFKLEYFLQGGLAGAEEMFAEGYGTIYGNSRLEELFRKYFPRSLKAIKQILAENI